MINRRGQASFLLGVGTRYTRERKNLFSLVIGVIGIVGVLSGCAAASAQADSPAWKLLAVTGPTNLPPVQSEVQRVTVEADGGTFAVSSTLAEGEGTVHFVDGEGEIVEGSKVVDVAEVFEGEFQIGQIVEAEGIPAGTTVTAVSGTPGAPELELSSVAFESSPFVFLVAGSTEITGVTTSSGRFAVGQELSGKGVREGATITAVGSGTLTMSEIPRALFGASPAVKLTATGTSVPVAHDASAADLQAALDGLPGISPGELSVSGGPGGEVEHPFFVAFGGELADQDVSALVVNGSSLEGEHHAVHIFTVVPGGEGTGVVSILPANVGSLASSGQIEVTFGPLPPGIVTSGPAGSEESSWSCPGGAGQTTITCTTEGSVPGDNIANGIHVGVKVSSSAPSSSSVPVRITGGNGGTATYEMPVTVSTVEAPFGIQALWAGAFDADGNLENQAGAHPATAMADFRLNTIRSKSGEIVPVGDPKDVLVDLPPGFIGNPMTTPRCPQSQLANVIGGSLLCNNNMVVGTFNPQTAFFEQSQSSFAVPVFNDVPADGYAAEFTTTIASPEVSLFGSVRSSEDFGVRVAGLNVPTYNKVFGAFTALDGSPFGAAGKAFLTNGAACSENARVAPVATVVADTWQNPGFFSSAATQELPAMQGCDQLEFTPSFSFQPNTTQGSSGTGAVAHLHLPQEDLLDPAKLAQPDLKKAVVILPAGISLNASSAKGLEACSEAQIGLITTTGDLPNPIRFDEDAPSCPDGSKLGTVTVKTPLLEEEVGGTIYLAEQEKNPFGSLLATYLAIESPRFGLQVKLAGKVEPDPATGQLTATFDYNPQVPVEDLTLNFRGGGPQSEFATPEVCGHYATTGSLEPWSAPESGPPVQIKEGGFDVSGGCSSADSTRPFSPGLEAGTTGTQAGAYSPLVIKVTRKDGEQELKSLDFTLPKGLTAKLAGIPYCPEGAIANAEGKSGKAEQASASCPSSSQIGTVDTSAGVGSEPFHVGGKVYLAGPYKGALLSSVVITPAVAGPFDLGDVVIRAPLYVDPETTEVTAKSDSIPTILRGIPLKVRSVAITLDRSLFTLNPTSCNVMEVTSTMQGSSGATAKPANRFQVGGCDKLGFKPQLKISLKGSTRRGGLPALKAVVTYPKKGAYSNIRRAQVNLPHSEFLEQSNLNKTCTKPVLLEGKCPKSTIYGKAKAWTPLLDEPLEGPVYLVGGYGFKLPALVADLNGQIRVVLKGKVDSGKNKGIRNTFEAVPDAPVSRFVLEMKGGKKYGLLINSESLCAKPQHAIVRFTAQNGQARQWKPKIANQCGKSKKQKKRASESGGKRR